MALISVISQLSPFNWSYQAHGMFRIHSYRCHFKCFYAGHCYMESPFLNLKMICSIHKLVMDQQDIHNFFLRKKKNHNWPITILPLFVFYFMFYQLQIVMCFFFSHLNFDYFIRKIKQINGKLWLMEYKVERKKWYRGFIFFFLFPSF